MSNISDLIQEAKPLYFKRKRRRNAIKTSIAASCLGLLIFASLPQSNSDYLINEWDLGDKEWQTYSMIEDLGLPVDEYGLLKVA